MFQPLRQRDYALLVTGSIVSLLGDGFFYVALAWQVYSISNVPTAMALVGAAGTLPFVVFLLVGGAFSDRYDRRRMMIASDVVRAATVAGMALLSATGALELWHVAVLISVQSASAAFFFPASSAILPDLVADEHLTAANSLAGMYRPLMLRIVGPALAGFVIAIAGPAPAFAVDSASFLVSALAVSQIKTRRQTVAAEGHGLRRTITEVREGLRFARSTPWIWATLVAAMMSLLVFVGPVEVLLPYLVKNKLGLGPDSLGLIFAAGGVGAIGVSLIVGSRGMPKRRVTVMYTVWSLGVLVIALFGFMTALWQALLISLALQGLFTAGSIIWETMLQQLVPRRLLGRVSSLDWLVSTGLVPVSYVLTAPAADLLGPEATIVAAGVIGAVLMGMLLFVPGVRDPERMAQERDSSPSLDGSAAR
jgi:DHA3 family tetracycline resistance protein-like MFS transporter